MKKLIFILALTIGFSAMAQNQTVSEPMVKVANLPFENSLDVILTFLDNTPVEITVYNIIGEQVYKGVFDSSGALNVHIPTASFNKGIYLLTVKQGGNITTKKITKK